MNLTILKRITIALVFVCRFESAHCQENYLPGYIIQTNKDTLKGFIDYKNWRANPKEIVFKEKLTDKKFHCTPQNIKGFGVADEFYESAIVKREIDRPNELNPQLDLKTDTVFLQTIVRGAKSLYYYLPLQSRGHFYVKHDSSSFFELLVYKKYITDNSSGKFESKNTKYFNQLLLYLDNCETLRKSIRQVNYTQKDLKNLFTTYYNKCTETKINFEKKTEKDIVEFGIVAGPVLNSINFSGNLGNDDTESLTNTKYKSNVNFSGGIFLETTFARARRRLSMYNELLFTKSKFSGSYTNYYDASDLSNYYTSNTNFGFSFLKFNNMIRYKYVLGKLPLFVNGGFSIGYVSVNDNHKTKTFSHNTVPIETYALDESAIRKLDFGLIGGLGAMLKKYSFEVRYEHNKGTYNTTTANSTMQRVHFLFGYRF